MRLSSALVFWLGSTGIACADTLWDHNGSVMSLLQNGDERYFFYENPRQGMRDAGVTPGTLFFDGRRIGDELHGTARVFSSKCDQPMTFFISGPILPEGRIILEGMRPVFKDCKASSEMKLDRLEFTFLQTFVPEVSLAERLGTTEADAAGADLEAAEPSSTADQQKPAIDVAALLKAGMGGDASAFKELARIFAEGDGVAQSTERSVNFLKKAAELGNKEAQAEWASVILEDPNASSAEQELAASYVLGRADELVRESGGDVDVSPYLEAPSAQTETTGSAQSLVFPASAFQCVATGCEQLTSAQTTEILKSCNNFIEVLTREGYLFDSFEDCVLTDVGGSPTVWAQASGPEVASVSIGMPQNRAVSVGVNLNGYPTVRDCWKLSLDTGNFTKTASAEQVSGPCR